MHRLTERNCLKKAPAAVAGGKLSHPINDDVFHGMRASIEECGNDEESYEPERGEKSDNNRIVTLRAFHLLRCSFPVTVGAGAVFFFVLSDDAETLPVPVTATPRTV